MALIPLFRISRFFVIPQVLIVLFCLKHSIRLFGTWKDKQKKYKILMAKNKDSFRPDSFKVFMQAPCGRLLVKAVLKDLSLLHKYKELLQYKPALSTYIKKSCTREETKVYFYNIPQNKK